MAQKCRFGETLPRPGDVLGRGSASQIPCMALSSDEPSVRDYTRRTNPDGSIDSICMYCFATISLTWTGYKLNEEELSEAEAAHRCPHKKRAKAR
jgi:hypothetical protein